MDFVEHCHRLALSVILDVVYNHLGPVGNHFYPPLCNIFSERYSTPWGRCINYDGPPGSDFVREIFAQNVEYWLKTFRFDGLRFDAVHAIFDSSPKHILTEMTERANRVAQEEGRVVVLIAESDLNDPRVVSPGPYGYGFDGQWSDDFHHALHAVMTGENNGYYSDFGRIEDLVDAYNHSFVYNGRYSAYRQKTHGGADASRLARWRFVVYMQNHDQVGNRFRGGERMSTLVDFETYKIGAVATIMSPFTPMIFMGEEYMEENPPFLFFSDRRTGDEEGHKEGRKREFMAFGGTGDLYDPPTDVSAFQRSKLDWRSLTKAANSSCRRLYSDLISMRRTMVIGSEFIGARKFGQRGVVFAYRHDGYTLNVALSFPPGNGRMLLPPLSRVLLDTGWKKYGGGERENTRAVEDSSAVIYMTEGGHTLTSPVSPQRNRPAAGSGPGRQGGQGSTGGNRSQNR
ncbi:hypothetical protein [Thermogymnomonas acidicola]|uniref:alpha-amylase family glycosyl hydrolase n=1 Tax=Thermogymnomonas acidicola TaxID=399579 RepID=UPI0009463BF7|nr:alpha-amylase family glycosyl hydrolase [Thermogymnomonas acidicola]